MYAPGLPDKRVKSQIPSLKDEKLSYVVQEHNADVAGLHYDFRIGYGGVAYSWATKKGIPPNPGLKHLFIRQPDHTTEYMNFTGMIEDGYGKGKVSQKEKGTVHILESRPDLIKFVIYKGYKVLKFNLVSIGNDNWLCINVTPTRENRPEIPLKKPKAAQMGVDELDFKTPGTILMPKIDGSASIFLLKKDRPIEVFSYRKSKRGPELINRTFKYPELYNKKAPKELDNTIVWGEAYVTDSEGKALPHRESVGLLNATTPKAMAIINKKGYKFDNVIFNVQKFKNREVIDSNYGSKLELLKTINKHIPELKIPEIAKTEESKKKLFDLVRSKKYPQTTEGFVQWDLFNSKPTKAKIKGDIELYVQGYEEGKGSLVGSLGKILATPDEAGSGPVTRVGGGFTHAQRKEIWENKKKYMKLPIKIEYQEILPSGKFRMPIFKSFRTDEFWES